MSSSVYSGFLLNYSDISPMFAGSMMGMTQFPANFPAFLAPIFVGNVVVDFVSGFVYLLKNKV